MSPRKVSSKPAADTTPAATPSPAAQVEAQLARYRAMRDFSTTAEPAGDSQADARRASEQGLPFVIQKHAATRLHYDFRLALHGTLKSWAVAKGPSYVVKDRRLAVEVEDHPIEYGGFEGIIPRGQYGGGTVLIWDQGTWEPQPGHDPDQGLRDGQLKFVLHGTKLHGKWALIRMAAWGAKKGGPPRAGDKPNWLLIKEHDEFEQPAEAPAITDSAPDSVVTGRSLEQIAKAEDHTWQSNRPAEGDAEHPKANHAANYKAPSPRARLAKANLRSTVPVHPQAQGAAPGSAHGGEPSLASRKRASGAGYPEQSAHSPEDAAGPHIAAQGASPERAGSKRDTKATTTATHLVASDGDLLALAPKEAFPAFLPPQLATATTHPPTTPGWLHELKLDGYRMQLHLRAGQPPTLFTRSGLDWTHRVRQIAAAAAQAFPSITAVLDGEVTVLDEHGLTSFARLQASFDEGANHPLTFFAFDLLHLEGHNTRPLALRNRKALLSTLLAQAEKAGPLPAEKLRSSDYIESAQEGPSSAAEVFANACRLGAEGIIAKRSDSPYLGTRNNDWLKLKCVRRQEFVIGGWTLPGTKSRSALGGPGIGSLLLGYYRNGELVHCGRTGTGFPQQTQRMLRGKLEALRAPASPFRNKLDSKARKDAVWVRPELVCEVEFTSWTADGAVRHASFQGLREDKRAEEVTLEPDATPQEKPVRRHPEAETVKEASPAQVTEVVTHPQGQPQSSPSPTPATTPREAPTLAGTRANPVLLGVRFTHPDKILDPESSVTKLQLALFYQAIAPFLLPHIADRPSSLVRCPDGATRPCFFQKHVNNTTPRTLPPVEVRDKKTGKPEQYLTVPTPEALVSLAQLGVLEIHPWGSRAHDLEHPDRLIFDLDPDEALPWSTLVASARSIRALLGELSLPSFVKTTGGKGLHLVVPIAPTVAWPQIKLFTHNIAAAIESSDPKLYLIKMTKAARKGRIFLDYLRNERGSTAVAPFSPRARPGMRVALPLAWEELDSFGETPPQFAVANFEAWRGRLAHDPWAEMHSAAKPIRPEVLDAVLAMKHGG